MAIPAARHAPDHTHGPSATPIYDALYTEYLRSFRTLPGDRSGEEELVFRAFAAMGDHHPELVGPGAGHPGAGRHAPGPWVPGGRPGPAGLLPAVFPGPQRRSP